MRTLTLILFACLSFSVAGAHKKDVPPLSHKKVVKNAAHQVSQQLAAIKKQGKVLNPRTINEDGSTRYIKPHDWTSGFYSGLLWYMYELTGDKKYSSYAKELTESLEEVKNLKWHHDVGFMINCSYGNALRITNNKAYEEVLITAAKSLSTRFRPAAGVTQSWNVTGGWQAKRGWKCPVIIDNMMNLELLFKATELSGDSTFYKLAISHADQTMKNHFRADNSSFHVVDYDPETGEVRKKNTAQGYADSSAWARGQAWGLYGYTVCYRATKDVKYLKQAEKIARFMLEHPNLPADMVPYWDFNAPKIPNEPRDASAAAITASALYELSTYSKEKKYFRKSADKIMDNLASDAFTAQPDSNNYFILMHSVGSIPHGAEIDVPLNYADYYFLEALLRKKSMK
ncbi:glucuronyl hydrolase [Prolixibacteraceae bacterium JC049]|nr:glucuronyl hydrolase [Prolixibacteraceae bacterium JC049]